MNTSVFKILLGLSALFMTSHSSGQAVATGKCPDFKNESAIEGWRINNPAVNCRAACSSNSDCTSVKDKCGRMVFTNNTYKNDIETAIKGLSYSCTNQLEAVDSVGALCDHKKCGPAYKSCAEQVKLQTDFLAKKVSTECASDADCTIISVPGDKCIRRLPVGRTSDMTKFSLDLLYLRDAVVSACNIKSIKECNAMEKAYCVSKECVVFLEKPPYKNFVNLEGPNYRPNFASNTVPVKMPRASYSKCSQDTECTETTGICSQYIVSLNKKHLAGFKADLEKMEKSIACPASAKIQIPKSRCFKEFCSFVN